MKHIFYYIVFFSWYLLSLLPLRVLYLLSDLLYFPLYYCIRYRRRIVRKNLTESFPEKDIQEIVRIEKDFYSYFCDYVVETIKLLSMSEKQMRKRMTFGGIDAVSKILQEKSCVTMIGHYCNWEWITSLPLHLNQEIVSAQIYHELENPAFDSLFLRLRSRFKAVNLEMMNALRQIIIYKKENKRSIIGFIADQAPNWNSINLWTDFLNHKTAVFTGGERIAK